MFARQRSPGLWTFDSVITGAELEYWDASVANAIDGSGGGAYSLQSDIAIGGAGGVEWTFQLPVVFDGSLSANDDIYLGSNSADALIVAAQSVFQGNATFDNDVEFNDPTVVNDFLTVNGQTTFTNTVGFSGAVFIDGNVNIGSSSSDLATIDAESDFVGNALFENGVAFEGTVVTNGAGNLRVRRVRRQTAGADADASIDVTLTDHVTVAAGVLSATRSYTISDTGAVNGDRVRFSNFDPAFGIAVKNPAGTTLEAIISGTGSPTWVDVERIAGTWRLFPGPDNP